MESFLCSVLAEECNVYTRKGNAKLRMNYNYEGR